MVIYINKYRILNRIEAFLADYKRLDRIHISRSYTAIPTQQDEAVTDALSKFFRRQDLFPGLYTFHLKVREFGQKAA